MTPRLITACSGLALLLPLLACVSLPSVEGLPSLDLDTEWRLGERLAREFEGRLVRHPDAEAQRLLEEFARPLVLSGTSSERPWRIALVVDEQAFTLHAPGGLVFVSDSLIEAVDDDAQFAGLLAHEIAHAQLRHGLLLLAQAHGPELMASIARGERSAVRQDVVANLAAGGSFARFGLESELEADREAERLLELTGREAAGLKAGLLRLVELGSDRRQRESRSLTCHPPSRLRWDGLGAPPRSAMEQTRGNEGRPDVDRDLFRRLRERLSP